MKATCQYCGQKVTISAGGVFVTHFIRLLCQGSGKYPFIVTPAMLKFAALPMRKFHETHREYLEFMKRSIAEAQARLGIPPEVLLGALPPPGSFIGSSPRPTSDTPFLDDLDEIDRILEEVNKEEQP